MRECPLRVYIAAPFELQTRARVVAEMLVDAGMESTSRWLATADENCPEWAARCLADVARADILVALNPAGWERTGTGGRHCEVGAALMIGKPVVVVGIRSNLFHRHGRVVHIASCDELVRALQYVAAVHGFIPLPADADVMMEFKARFPSRSQLS